jgi:hypothetical protein
MYDTKLTRKPNHTMRHDSTDSNCYGVAGGNYDSGLAWLTSYNATLRSANQLH